MSAIWIMTSRLLRRGLTGMAALLVAICLFELLQPIIAKSFGGPEAMASLLKALPPAFQALARTRPEFLASSGLPAYLSLGFTHPLYLVLASAGIVAFTARGLAGEMERGTIQLALARPVSRTQVYLARVAGLIVIAVALAVAGPIGTIVGMLLAQPHDSLTYRYLAPMAIVAAALFWAIGGLALLGSAALDSTSRAVAWATGALATFYFIDYFAALWKTIKPLDPLSIFNYYDPGRALVHGTIGLADLAVLVAVGIAATLAGLIIFLRRDLPT